MTTARFLALAAALAEHARLADRTRVHARDLCDAVATVSCALLGPRHREIARHAERVTDLADRIARRLGLDSREREAIRIAAVLHDLGKLGVTDSVLEKPGPLDPDEWHSIRAHPELGHRLLAGLGLPPESLAAVRHHHERHDGTGYPDGLAGDGIPLGARIIAVADAYDAMVARRPYRGARPEAMARMEVARCSGSHFCPRVVAAFLTVVRARSTAA